MAPPAEPFPSPFHALAAWVERYEFRLRISEQGRVISVGDGIVWIQGLPSTAIDDVLRLEDGSRAMVFHLAEELVGAILLEQTAALTAGTPCFHSGVLLSIPVGDALLGRVVDPLGRPLDGLPAPMADQHNPIDVPSPPIIARDFVNEPLFTGNTILDTLVPVGKGQRQLLIGDNGLGKSTLALDVVIHQRDRNVRCVYVLVGQKRSSVLHVMSTLQAAGAMAGTTVVVAEATALPGLQYLAPFSGCSLAEGWMRRGHDTLVVYDDLTTHADVYRELSLLLKRPPGREAYPADIFYLHSRLLERSTSLSAALGGGTMTALPIVETREGEITSYIPTNLISITDGQVYFDPQLFAAGRLPAIDITRSVSRIGGRAQPPQIKAEAGRMKLDYLQFLELETFSRFGTKLEASMEQKIKRGRVLREILKQDQLHPRSITFQLAWMVAFNEGLLDDLPPDRVASVMARLERQVAVSSLRLGDARGAWQAAVSSWVGQGAAR